MPQPGEGLQRDQTPERGGGVLQKRAQILRRKHLLAFGLPGGRSQLLHRVARHEPLGRPTPPQERRHHAPLIPCRRPARADMLRNLVRSELLQGQLPELTAKDPNLLPVPGERPGFPSRFLLRQPKLRSLQNGFAATCCQLFRLHPQRVLHFVQAQSPPPPSQQRPLLSVYLPLGTKLLMRGKKLVCRPGGVRF